MSERERFEAWALSRKCPPELLSMGGDYGGNGLIAGQWAAWQAARSGQAAARSSQGARSDERVQRLQAAIEGECDGLAVDEHHAKAILDYVLGAQPEAPTADRRCKFCNGGASGSWCPTAEGCAAHGCHGECLPEEREAPTAAPLEPATWQMRTRFRDGEWSRWSECADLPRGEALEQVTGPLTMQFRPLYAHPPARSGAGSEEGQG